MPRLVAASEFELVGHSTPFTASSAVTIDLSDSLDLLDGDAQVHPLLTASSAESSDSEPSRLIPEPSTVALAGLASMFGLAGFLRKRWG